MVALSNADEASQAMLITAATEGRMIDRGNADLRGMRQDFRRIGVRHVSQGIAGRNTHWDTQESRRGGQAYYQDLIELRNALAHGNQRQLDQLRARGVSDRVTWHATHCGRPARGPNAASGPFSAAITRRACPPGAKRGLSPASS